MKTFKTRIYLNSQTVQYCKRAFGVRRCIWNWAVAASIEGRKQHQKRPSAFALDKSYRAYLAEQKDSCFVWLAKQQTSARLMQEVLKDVDQAFKLAVSKKGRKANVHFKTRKDKSQTFSGYLSDPAVFTLEGDLLEGTIPVSKRKLVEAWIEIHKEELKANWKLLDEGEQFFKIEPLK